MVNNSRRRINK